MTSLNICVMLCSLINHWKGNHGVPMRRNSRKVAHVKAENGRERRHHHHHERERERAVVVGVVTGPEAVIPIPTTAATAHCCHHHQGANYKMAH